MKLVIDGEVYRCPPRVVWRFVHWLLTQDFGTDEKIRAELAKSAEEVMLLIRGKRPILALYHIATPEYYEQRAATMIDGIAAYYDHQQDVYQMMKNRLAEIIASESKSPHHYYIYRGY